MRKKFAVITAVVFICLAGTQGAYPWGSLTHAFITSRIVNAGGTVLDNAIYGSTAPDFANYMFGSPYQNYLMDRTHADFIRVWSMAGGGSAHELERAVAFGFVAHNEEDYIAHSMSLTGDSMEGYVIQKAAVLNGLLETFGVWEQLGLDGTPYAAVRAELSHELIEFAGDILIARMDPGTGQVLAHAAAFNSGDLPELLTRAYAGNLVAFSNRNGIRLNQPSASELLHLNEFMFRGGMADYGNLMTNDDPDALIQNLALYLQQLAALQGIVVEDPDLVSQVLAGALFVIQDSFPDEIMATIPYVAGRLAQQRISY